MAPVTVQASVFSHARVAGVASRNVRSRGAARPKRMAMRPAVATAEMEIEAPAEAVVPETELAAGPQMPPTAPEVPAPEPQPAIVVAEMPATDQQPQRQRRQGPRRAGPGPARTLKVSDVEVGKEYDGTIVSIRDFGAFVNIGVNTDGLLHISQISTGFVRNVADAVDLNQDVRVRVINVDLERGKFALTMIPQDSESPPRGKRGEFGGPYVDDVAEGGERPQLKQQARAAKQQKPRTPRAIPRVIPGDIIKGKVAATAPFGVFIEIAENSTGLLHESEQRQAEGAGPLAVGDEVEVVVVSVRGDKVALSQRSAQEVAQERELKNTGVAVQADVPAGSSLLAEQLARAGISSGQFTAAVGAA